MMKISIDWINKNLFTDIGLNTVVFSAIFFTQKIHVIDVVPHLMVSFYMVFEAISEPIELS